MRSSRLVVGGVVVLRSTPPHRWRSNSTEPQFSLWYQEPVPVPVSVPVHGMSSPGGGVLARSATRSWRLGFVYLVLVHVGHVGSYTGRESYLTPGSDTSL